MSSLTSLSGRMPGVSLSDTEASIPPQKAVASLRVIFDSSSHASLLAAAEKAKIHFQSLPATENESAFVTEKIIHTERSVANNAAASASEAKNQAISIINALRYQCHDQELLSAVAALESRLKTAADQATQSATHAASVTQKQIVQVDTKSAALHAADARLALAQLRQLEPQRSKQGEADLKKAESDYQKASQELTSVIAKTSPHVQVTTATRAHHLDSAKEREGSDEKMSDVTTDSELTEDDEQADLGNGTWKTVTDEEALRRVEVERMNREDRRIE